MNTRVQVIFYSMYGHVHRLAEAVAEGARAVPETDVSLYQVAELVPGEKLKESGAGKARGSRANTSRRSQPDSLTEMHRVFRSAA